MTHYISVFGSSHLIWEQRVCCSLFQVLFFIHSQWKWSVTLKSRLF